MNFKLLAFSTPQKAFLLLVEFLFFFGCVFAQADFTITGKITDEGTPLANVTVQVRGGSSGTRTDEQGAFNIRAAKGQVLVFSYVGYETREVVVRDQRTIILNLAKTEGNLLDDVVVVGYGTRKKANLTGAVATITSKQLDDRPITNVSSALQGTMSGVTVVNNTGQPGRDQGSLRIRGIGTLGNSDAMVVVDGMISDMNDVNPSDIESISVLKDAASASIYGSRASNGVILITTRKGKAGETRVHYNTYVGKQKATRLPDYVDSWQAATFYNEALQNEGKNARYTDEEIQKFRDGSDPDNYSNTDWLKLFYNGSGIQQNHYVDVVGGGEKVQTMLSLGYMSQDGIVENTGFSRYTSRFKISSKLASRLTVNGNFAYSYENFQEPTNPYIKNFGSVVWQINRIGRNVPYKYSNGYYGYYDDGNPMAWLESGSQTRNHTHNLNGIVDADLEIVNGLHFKPMLGYRLMLGRSKSFIKDIQYYNWRNGEPTFYQGPNSLTAFNDDNSVITLQALLQYDKTIGRHDFRLLGGYSQEYTSYNYLRGYRKNFLNNSLSELDAGPIDGQQSNGSSSEIALESVFGRLNYSFNERYLFEANIRYDGSSRFAKENRWGTFPSFSAGWRISEENFFLPLRNVFSELKVRGSWGKLGNQNLVGNYPYIPTIASGQNYGFGGSIASGVAPVNGANTNIKWETTTSTDIGLDAVFLNGKINFTADYFVRNTDQVLLDIPVGSVYGFSPPVQNAGSVQNKGFEFDLGYHGQAKDFTYDIMANASFIKNTVTDLAGTDPIINGSTFMKVGLPINSFYGYQTEGIFQTQQQVDDHAEQSGGDIAPGDLMYKDQNKDNVIDGADRVYLGTYFPKVTYGVNIAVGWKGFDLSVLLQGAAGVKGFVEGEVLGLVSDKYGKPTSIYKDHWTADRPTDKFPRLWSSNTQNDAAANPSSFWIRGSGYMRVKNIQFGYTFNGKWLGRAGIQKLKVYYSGQNTFTFSNFYKWIDPEAPAAESGWTHPQVLVNTIGLNLTF
ncbi:MAG TPA: TonB-dependent receptor [Agriterribacter sp.]|nr:TonB-dependent receptor [Agriterribacter sp.]